MNRYKYNIGKEVNNSVDRFSKFHKPALVNAATQI